MSQLSSSSNQLLTSLPAPDYDRIRAFLERVPLSLGQVLYEPNQAIEYAYFPLSAVVSLLNEMEGGYRVETAAVGNEGMIGVPLVLGTADIPMRAIVQIAGEALRIPAKALQAELSNEQTLYLLLLRYIQALMSQISQNLACTRLHTAQERCCYLLLLTQDRIGFAELPLTHEGLSRMVGVRRDSIGSIVTTLERAGLVQHQRGRITILDRPGLEAAACECYRIVRSEFDRVLEGV